jgi:hypothetical protein
MKNKDNGKDKGLDDLLDYLKQHPQLVREIVFNPEFAKKMLRSSKAARRLVQGVDVTGYVGADDFLQYVAGPADGHPIAHCFKRTVALCAKGTQCAVQCGGATKTRCGGGTQTLV